ncbi:MAG: hypothetical protein IJ447_04325 [Clostridia bacterium]|nr:hypothetical protein [Clostridia bacterium]
MSSFFNTMPFGMFVLAMLCIMAVSVYEIIKIKNDETKAHNKYVMYALLILSPILILKRYMSENPLGDVFETIINILLALGTVIFFVSLFYAWKKSRKFVDSATANQQKSTLLTIGVIMAVLVVFILFVYHFL